MLARGQRSNSVIGVLTLERGPWLCVDRRVLRELGRRGEAEVRRDGQAAGTAAGMRPSMLCPVGK